MRPRPGVRAAAALAVLAALGSSGGARAAERDLAPLLADLDGDGRLESISLVPDGLRIDGLAAPRTLPLAAREIAPADVDCDGRLDIVLDGGARWLANASLLEEGAGERGSLNDTLAFSSVWDTDTTYLENTTRHIVWDFDGDGRKELVTSDYNGPTGADVATLRFLESTADNEWVEVSSFSDGPRIFSGMAVGDTDGDGKIELVAGKIGGSYLFGPYVGPRVYIFESDGDDSFVLDHMIEVDPVPSVYTLLDDLALGDADGDGGLDIAVGIADNADGFGSRIRAYTYDEGSGAYGPIYSHDQAGGEYVTAIDVGDADNDLNPEIVYFERVMVNVRRAEHNGAAFVLKTNPTGVSAGLCLDVSVMSTDGDGANEMLCGSALGADGNVVILESTGNDLFTVGFRDSAGIDNTVLYVDADTSFSPPLLAGSAHSHQVIALAYDGGASTYRTRAFFDVPAAVQLHEITIGRLDADGALDLMLTHFNGAFSSGRYEQREQIATGIPVVNSGPGSGRAWLANPSPNPFLAETALTYEIPREGAVRLEIMDLSGRRVATLATGRRPAGEWHASWRGVDDRGRPVSSGVYVARLLFDQEARTRRLTLVR